MNMQKGEEMNFLLLVLSESLKSRKPQLDLRSTDRKILHIAFEDLKNYLKVQWRLIGEEDAESKLRKKVRKYFYERREELEELVNLWTSMWMKKWNDRVKLVIGNRKHRNLKNIHQLPRKGKLKWKCLKDWSMLKDTAVEALIKNGEICGTSALAESLLKNELKRSDEKKIDQKDLLVTVNNLFKKAREISGSRGPLMFIRIDKRFWKIIRQNSRHRIY